MKILSRKVNLAKVFAYMFKSINFLTLTKHICRISLFSQGSCIYVHHDEFLNMKETYMQNMYHSIIYVSENANNTYMFRFDNWYYTCTID